MGKTKPEMEISSADITDVNVFPVSDQALGSEGTGGVEVQLHAILTLALEGGGGQCQAPSHFVPGVRPRYPLDRSRSDAQSRWILL